MADMKSINIALPTTSWSQVDFWAKKWGISKGKAMMYLLRLGTLLAGQHDTLSYTDYLARQAAKNKGAKDG